MIRSEPLRLSLLAQARLRREGALRAALARRPRATNERAQKGARVTGDTGAPTTSVMSAAMVRRVGHPPSHRPDRRRCARRRPASRALRVAMRWPRATLDPGHRRASGLAIGSVALSWSPVAAHPARTPEPAHGTASAPNARIRTGPDIDTAPGEAFAMRRSGVRNPLSSTKPAGQSPSPVILNQGDIMAAPHLLRVFVPTGRRCRRRSRRRPTARGSGRGSGPLRRGNDTDHDDHDDLHRPGH